MEQMDGLCVQNCTRCPDLVDSRSRIVNGVGPADADLLLVGEGPGKNEDEQGEPFVGRSGSVLDDALGEAGVLREEVRITNCVRCRPLENRDPKKEELANCRGYLETEIERVDPSLVITLGKVPSEHLLGRSVAITSEAGNIVETRLGDRSQRVLLSVHPAATLYDRSQREGFFETIETAVDIAGLGEGDGSGDGQSRLGDY
jgi:DNA polymerase